MRAEKDANDEHPFPIDLGRFVLFCLLGEIRISLRESRRDLFLGKRGGVFEGCGDADLSIGGRKGKPTQHADSHANQIGRP